MTGVAMGAGKAGARIAADTLYYGSKIASKGIGVYNALSGVDKLTHGKLFNDASAAVGKVANIAYKDKGDQDKFIDTVGGLMKTAGRDDMAANLRHTTYGGQWGLRPHPNGNEDTTPPQSNSAMQTASQPHAITAQQVAVPQAGGAVAAMYAPARRLRRKRRTLKIH